MQPPFNLFSVSPLISPIHKDFNSLPVTFESGLKSMQLEVSCNPCVSLESSFVERLSAGGPKGVQYLEHLQGICQVPCIQRYPVFRGVLYSGVSCIQGCPVFRGVLYSEVTSIQRCPVFRGDLYSEVSCMWRCYVHRTV